MLLVPLMCVSATAHAQGSALPFSDGFEVIAIVEPPNLAGITAQHNLVRAGVITVPVLQPLAWSASLAATAQAWANQCRDTQAPFGLVDHNPGRSDGHPWYVGENIFGGSAPYGVDEVVGLWAAEAANYDYASNTCSGVCGHYTQLVWRATAFVGCARSECPGLAFGHSVVCNYGPGGNTGGRPY